MKNLLLLGIWVLSIALVSCGGSDKDNKDNAASQTDEKTEETMSGTSSDAPANLQEAMKHAEEAMKNLQGDKKVEPVNFRELQTLLPEKLAGFTRKSRAGETAGAMGMNVSRAEANYEDGDCNVKTEIIDTGGLMMGIMGMAAWASATIDREDDNGYERTSTFDGQKSFEKYDKSSEEYSLAVLVENRFVVTTNGKYCDMDKMKKLVKAMDLGKLKKMG